MSAPVPRRTFLLGAATALSTTLGGCAEGIVSPDDATTRSRSPGDPAATPPPSDPAPPTTSRPETTTEPTPIPPPETQLSLDEWYEHAGVGYTVTSIECLTEFEDEATGNARSLPDDERLVIVETKVHNVGAGSDFHYADAPFAVSADGRAYDDVPTVRSFPIDQLPQVDHMARYRAEGRRIEFDETLRSWVVSIVPRSRSCGEVSVVFEVDDDDDGESDYPAEWQ